jgi:cell wall assembly regulator SMI1
MNVDESWDRIETWLSGNAPLLHAALSPPAPGVEIEEVARELNAPLPADLAAWWRRANGVVAESGGNLLPPFYQPHSIANALDSLRIHLQVCRELFENELPELERYSAVLAGEPAGSRCDEWIWINQWLPIATDNGGGGLLVDLRGGPAHGCVIVFDRAQGPHGPLWPSVAAMLAEIAEGLDHGVRVTEHLAYIEDDGRLSWWPAPDGQDIDLERERQAAREEWARRGHA